MTELLRFHSRMLFFVASFSPMWVILIGSYLIHDHSPDAIVISCLVVLVIVGAIIYSCMLFSRYRESINAEPIRLEYAKDITYKYAKHLIAYVFFALIDITSQHNVFILVSLVVFISIVFSRTNMVLTSPALFAIGFKMYEIRVTKPSRQIILLSRYYISKSDEISIIEIAPDIYVDKLKY